MGSTRERIGTVAAGFFAGGSVLTHSAFETLGGRPVGTLIAFASGLVLTLAWAPSLRRVDRTVVVAVLAFLGVHLVGLAVAPDPVDVLRVAAKEALGLAVLLTVLGRREGSALRRVLGWVATAVVAVHVILVAASFASVEVAAAVWDHGHEKLGALPRFHGLARNPAGLGFVLLACAGLARGHRERRLRSVTGAGAFGLCLITASFPALLAPLLLLGRLPRRQRQVAGALVVLLALLPLYLTPISLRVDDAVVYARAPESTIGLRSFMVGEGATRATLRTTAYFELVRGALHCFAAHPWVGVGAESFSTRCPVHATDTVGFAGPHRVHQQYLGMLAERGLLGAVVAVALVLALRRRWRLHPDSCRRQAILALLACGLVKAMLYLPMVVVLVATSLRRSPPRLTRARRSLQGPQTTTPSPPTVQRPFGVAAQAAPPVPPTRQP